MRISTIVRTGIILSASVFSLAVYAQPKGEARTYAGSITVNDLRHHLEIIASDEYEGRETAEQGQKKAAGYISTQFKSLGLSAVGDNGYYQTVPLIRKVLGERLFEVNQQKYTLGTDFYFTRDMSNASLSSNEIYFCGYGIKDELRDDYKGIDVKGKVIVFMGGEPVSKKGIYFLSKSAERSDWSKNHKKKIGLLRDMGAAAIICIDPDFARNGNPYGKMAIRSGLGLRKDLEAAQSQAPVIYISENIANELLRPNRKTLAKVTKRMNTNFATKPLLLSSTMKINIQYLMTNTSTENVLGYLEGTDLKDEVVVVSAHYDHLGVKDGKVFNGADDNGSGTVAVMEIAEAFSLAKKKGDGPRRSVLFLTVSGEEKGLLGSDYYTTHPVFPLENTVVDLNIDMIGRVDKAHEEHPNYVYLIGSDRLSKRLHQVSEDMNKAYTQLNLDYTYNDPKDPNQFYYRSDHYNFAKNGIPIIFYFNGTHEDYHMETDEVSKINYDILQKRTQLVFHTAWEIANRAERIVADTPAPAKKK